jgi:hypothetical protein
MNLRTEVVLIVAGTLILAGGVALELAGKSAPPELWVAGTGALTGALGLAAPGSSGTSSLIGELERLVGYGATKASATAVSQPAPAASGSVAKEPGSAAASVAAPAPVTPARVGAVGPS